MKFAYLIWCAMTRKKVRALLTILSTVVAFILFGFLCGIRQALVGGVEVAGADRLIVRDKVSIIQLMPITHKDRMDRIPGVAFATHQTWFGGIYQDPKNFFMQNPVEPEDFLKMHPEILLPKEQLKAWLDTRTGAIVGRPTMERFHWHIGDKIPIMSPIWRKSDGSQTWTFDIVGVYTASDKRTDTTPLFFRYDYFDESRNNGKGLVGWYTIKVKDPARAVEIAKAVDAEFENSPNETKTEPEGAFAQAWASQIGDITLIVAGIMGAVFFTLLLVTGNDMAQGVRERVGEIGVLKAIGFSDGQVLGLVLFESCFMTMTAGTLGLVLATLMISRGDPTGGLLPLFNFPTHDFFIGLGLALALGIASGLIPALQAMRLRVADALRRI
jgi:putative ABC transport system permease protein